MKKSERVAQNGLNYRCLECGIRSREIPTCEHCAEKPKRSKKPEPEESEG